MTIAAMLGSTVVSLGGVAAAAALGTVCWLGADVIRDTAVVAEAERKRQREEEQYREDDAVIAFEWQMALEAARAAEQSEQAAGHVEQLIRQREQRARSTGRVA